MLPQLVAYYGLTCLLADTPSGAQVHCFDPKGKALVVPALHNPRQLGLGDQVFCALDDSGSPCWTYNDKKRELAQAMPSRLAPVDAGAKLVSSAFGLCLLDSEKRIRCGGPDEIKHRLAEVKNVRAFSFDNGVGCAIFERNQVVCGSVHPPEMSQFDGPLQDPREINVAQRQACLADGDQIHCWGYWYYGGYEGKTLTAPGARNLLVGFDPFGIPTVDWLQYGHHYQFHAKTQKTTDQKGLAGPILIANHIEVNARDIRLDFKDKPITFAHGFQLPTAELSFLEPFLRETAHALYPDLRRFFEETAKHLENDENSRLLALYALGSVLKETSSEVATKSLWPRYQSVQDTIALLAPAHNLGEVPLTESTAKTARAMIRAALPPTAAPEWLDFYTALGTSMDAASLQRALPPQPWASSEDSRHLYDCIRGLVAKLCDASAGTHLTN